MSLPAERLPMHAVLARGIADQGVDIVFGLVGDGNLYVVDSLERECDVRYVSAAHEAGAVQMADAYARVSGRLGVVTVTHGPALTNTVTALTEATRARTPLLAICGDTAASAVQHLQKIDQAPVVDAAGAGFVQVRSSETVLDDLAEAIRRIHHEHRPVVLNVPIDLQWDEIAYEPRPAVQPDVVASAAPMPDVERAAGIIAGARRPVLIAGRGALAARDVMVELATLAGAPVSTTLLAKELFAGVPTDLGVFGTLSNPVTSDYIAGADVLIVFGAGLNKYTTSSSDLTRDKHIVQCDVDPGRIGRWERADVALVGDATVTATELVRLLRTADLPSRTTVLQDLAGRLAAYRPEDTFVDRSTDSTIDLRTALLVLDHMLPRDRTLVTDGGRFVHHALRHLSLGEPASMAAMVSFGSIGLGMGAAVGAGLARPDRPVVGVFGDGGFMLGGLSEFNSAVRHGVDLVAVVFNDSSYGSEHVQMYRKGLDPGLTMFDWPNLAQLGDALGGQGVTVRNLAELKGLEDTISTRRRPLLIEVKVDPAVLSRGA